MLSISSPVCNVAAASFPFIPVILAAALFTWIFSGWLLYRIGKKLGYEKAWYAWVPFMFVYMMVELSDRDKDWFWYIVILIWIPCIGIVPAIMFFMVVMDLTEKCGKPRWWGILWLIPFVIWIVMYITGSGEAPPQPQSRYDQPPSGGYPSQLPPH